MDRKVIAITGGAQGQGRLHAIKFAENGYDVALADMQEPTSERFQETVRELNELGAQVLAMKADVTSAEEMEAFSPPSGISLAVWTCASPTLAS